MGILNGLLEAWVSIKRVEKFLSLSEINLDEFYVRTVADDTEETIVEVEEGGFTWKSRDEVKTDEKKEEKGKKNKKDKTGEETNQNQNESTTVEATDEKVFKLSGINLHIEKGSFIGIIGKVGSGKSTLIFDMRGN